MATPYAHHPVPHDDPHDQEPLTRRYGWATLLYAMFAVLVMLLFVMVR